ncbi:uncharacterized protein K452DRAFT_232589 [Aplosporella prunicola CBS 121167]|uniref:Glycosyltransferase family 32 protein n=1 Tax=Aplosporella prunicola CBS 121167 TaxID=1176127 RepID=A0A6A6B705_9PEZI|nr:uncharacterized protein K452DRAFT_232589 [Aplosporella prunicola CBS 121167]KAF2139428.1 hypothetical protein K452DRAFT_232589 [Aplosporella prunicola CBS 121167]
MAEGSRLRGFCTLVRNLVLAALLYTCILGIISVAKNPSVRPKGKLGIPAFLGKSGPVDLIESTRSGVKVKFAGSPNSIHINPHANVFNRPDSAVTPKDDFLGPRPDVDTEANLPMLVEECRGTYNGIEKMRNVFECLQFLANDEHRYYQVPEDGKKASQQDPRKSEYLDSDGHGNSLDKYVSPAEAVPASKESIGTCSGPIVPYHTYWTGPATWRVEVFIKSYLYTQNLACSRLYLWVDADKSPNAVENMLVRDPLFARFLPLVERGDITVMPWRFPQRIPLPNHVDHADGAYKPSAKPNAKGETVIAEGVVEDADGQQWLSLTPKQMTFLPVAVSDAMRFVVLHLYGGLYFDMDVLMLRDMRPLAIPKDHAFAERWAAHAHPGDYNTAIMSLSANSSLSSYLLRGGVRMGLNFHPRVIGRMAWKDGRDQEFLMLETAAFDPIWTEFNWDREGRCTVPCLKDYSAAFKGRPGAIKDEWQSYDGPQLEPVNHSKQELRARVDPAGQDVVRTSESASERPEENVPHSATAQSPKAGTQSDSFTTTSAEEAELRAKGAVADYRLEEDKYPPNNRTVENFFRGAWTYHIHNQWLKHPEPSSWINIVEIAHDGFFAGKRTNPYGELWHGPDLMPYNYWPEFV